MDLIRPCEVILERTTRDQRVSKSALPRSLSDEVPCGYGEQLPCSRIPLRLPLYSGRRAWNPSIAKVQDRIFVTYNYEPNESQGNLTACGIRIAELATDLVIRADRPVQLGSAMEVNGDMRLFVHEGKLCGVYFQGTLREEGSGLILVFFDKDLNIVDRFCPTFGQRRRYEKNWQFFSHCGNLMCVYKVKPHIVLRREGDAMRAVANSDWRIGFWRRLLGGTPPIEFEGEYLSFFHSWRPWVARGMWSWKFLIHPGLCAMRRSVGWPFAGAGTWPHRIYSAGAYTFEKRAPFRVVRITREPLMEAPIADASSGLPACIFPCGACWHHGLILVSYGYHDRECRLAAYTTEYLQRVLVDI